MIRPRSSAKEYQVLSLLYLYFQTLNLNYNTSQGLTAMSEEEKVIKNMILKTD